ncbi:MAG: nitroreductase family protein [Clostridiales bacterium]|jgi:nitroreductase|nr:nitroreductase family protein [Clostridiales bacterium]
MNETLKTIAGRYSCRSFSGKTLSDADLQTIADAGLAAPSGMNRRHWQIIVVKNKTLLSELETEGLRVMSEYPDKTTYDRIMSRGGKLFYDAPVMIFIAVKEAFPKGAELIDLGIAAQNIALAATSLGIDNCICGLVAFAFAGGKAEEFKRKLKFQNGYECGLCVLLGYADEPGTPRAIDKNKLTFID